MCDQESTIILPVSWWLLATGGLYVCGKADPACPVRGLAVVRRLCRRYIDSLLAMLSARVDNNGTTTKLVKLP